MLCFGITHVTAECALQGESDPEMKDRVKAVESTLLVARISSAEASSVACSVLGPEMPPLQSGGKHICEVQAFPQMHLMTRPAPSDQVSARRDPSRGYGGTTTTRTANFPEDLMLGSQRIVHNWSLIGGTV